LVFCGIFTNMNSTKLFRQLVVYGALAFTGIANAQSDATKQVRVDTHESQLTLTVFAPVALRVVVNEFCHRTGSHCEGTELATQLFPACSVTGTWRQIVAQLFEGTGLNYVASQGSSLFPASIAISRGSFASGSARSAPYPTPAVSAEHGSPTVAQMSNELRDSDGTDSMESGQQTEAVTEGSVSALAGSPRFLPLPDEHGGAAPAGASVSGTPFPLAAASSTSDANREGFLPFAGPDGRGIPAKPAEPGNPFGPSTPKR
jgi:hypothetical protein